MRALQLTAVIAATTMLSAPHASAEDFTISITVDPNSSTPTATATGNVSHTLTIPERTMFGLGFWPLDTAITKIKGLGPNSIFLSDPTFWGNSFAEFNWPQTTTTITVLDTTVSTPSQQVQALDTYVFCNSSSSANTQTATLSASSTNSLSSGWSKSFTKGFSFTVGAEVGIDGGKVSDSDTISLSTTSGTSGSQSSSSTIQQSQSVSVTLQPGEKRQAIMSAQKGTLVVEVLYQIAIEGSVMANYEPAYQGHHFYNFPLSELMNSAGLPMSIQATQTFTLDYFHSSSLNVVDYDGICDGALTADS